MGGTGRAFGQRIKQARLNLAAALGRVVTQTEVADQMGVTGVTIGRWESGEKEPSLETIVRLAEVLRVTPAYLAFGEGIDLSQQERIDAAIRSPGRQAPPPKQIDDDAPARQRRRKSG